MTSWLASDPSKVTFNKVNTWVWSMQFCLLVCIKTLTIHNDTFNITFISQWAHKFTFTPKTWLLKNDYWDAGHSDVVFTTLMIVTGQAFTAIEHMGIIIQWNICEDYDPVMFACIQYVHRIYLSIDLCNKAQMNRVLQVKGKIYTEKSILTNYPVNTYSAVRINGTLPMRP